LLKRLLGVRAEMSIQGPPFSKILFVHASTVLRAMLQRVLASEAREVLVAPDLRLGQELIARHCDIDLVICDVELPDGDGFEMLRCVQLIEEPKPQVILVTGRTDSDDKSRAAELGAIGALNKPVSLSALSGMLQRFEGDWQTQRSPRRRSNSTAYLVAPSPRKPLDSSLEISWVLRDVSETGAFVESEAPIPVGTALELALEIEPQQARVLAEVVRIQEPDWVRPGGVGLTFRDLEAATRLHLANYVAQRTPTV